MGMDVYVVYLLVWNVKDGFGLGLLGFLFEVNLVINDYLLIYFCLFLICYGDVMVYCRIFLVY